MNTPTIAQMRARMNGGHRRLLQAAVDGVRVTTQRIGDARGYCTCRVTLQRWGALDGDNITAVGRALLDTSGRLMLAEFREKTSGLRRDDVPGGAA